MRSFGLALAALLSSSIFLVTTTNAVVAPIPIQLDEMQSDVNTLRLHELRLRWSKREMQHARALQRLRQLEQAQAETSPGGIGCSLNSLGLGGGADCNTPSPAGSPTHG